MKSLLTFAGALAFSTIAHAGSINYDLRVDANGTDYNDAAGKPDYTKFYFKTGRVDFKGKLNDDISYQLRWAYTKSQVPQTRDSSPAGIELGYITHKMNDLFSLSLGKINTLIGGFEAATPGPDLYLTSANYNKASALALPGRNEGTLTLLYNTGAKASFNFAEQTQVIDIVATDNITDSTNGVGNTDFNQNRGLLGLIWRGAFMEKALNFMVSYHTVSPQTTNVTAFNAKDAHNFASAGVKWDSDPMIVTLEYLTTSFKDDVLGNTDTLNSIVARVIYKMDAQFTPRIEATMSEEKREIGATVKNKYNGLGVAVEYKPTEDNFRYHLAYAMYTDKPEGATGDPTRQEIVLGARLYGDFLK